jgi:hypothetical protein
MAAGRGFSPPQGRVGLVAHEGPAMAQQKGKKLLTFLAKILCRGLARPDEITHRFMDGIGHPHRCQFTRAKEPRKRHRVTSVGFDPLARLLRDQRWRDDSAVMTQGPHLAVQSLSCRTGFVADVQPVVAIRQLADHFLDRRRRAVDLTKISDLTFAADIGDGHSVLLFHRVNPDECFTIRYTSSWSALRA